MSYACPSPTGKPTATSGAVPFRCSVPNHRFSQCNRNHLKSGMKKCPTEVFCEKDARTADASSSETVKFASKQCTFCKTIRKLHHFARLSANLSLVHHLNANYFVIFLSLNLQGDSTYFPNIIGGLFIWHKTCSNNPTGSSA